MEGEFRPASKLAYARLKCTSNQLGQMKGVDSYDFNGVGGFPKFQQNLILRTWRPTLTFFKMSSHSEPLNHTPKVYKKLSEKNALRKKVIQQLPVRQPPLSHEKNCHSISR